MPQGTSQQPTMIETRTQTSPVQSTGRLKYADPRDLPRYPSRGLRSDGAAASAAASLGWSTQKPTDSWKPDKTSSASAAAMLAKSYKMAPAWEPDTSSAPARAALLAVGSSNSTNKSDVPRSAHEGFVSSAATQAFNSSRSNSMKQSEQTMSAISTEGQRSLAAAKGAMSGNRRRAISTPASPPTRQSYPGESLAASNALSGATLAHRASIKPKPSVEGVGAVPVTTMTRNMFTSNPPVKPEVDEQQKNEQLHATAVAMARKMYTQQQKIIEQTKSAHGQDSGAEVKPYVNLQDAAFKQAQERLAKLQEEHEKKSDFQEYYSNAPPPRRRFSITSKLRRRASSDGDLDDHQRSERIRQQMSMFSDKLSQVDAEKRQRDRDAVMAAAQRNVKAQLQGMDEKVLQETGQVNPSLTTEWHFRAHQKAQVFHEVRNEHKGKIDIGAGKFMDPSEVDAIATKRVQPVLDDISAKAEAERERQMTTRMDQEAKKSEEERQRARDRELKEIQKKLKDQERQEEKARRHQEKMEEKAKKDEERHMKAEQKRQAKGEKKKVKAEDDGDDSDSVQGESRRNTAQSVEPPAPTVPETRVDTTENEPPKSPETGSSPTAKVKGWIKNRFSRGKSVGEGDKPSEHKRSFLGGVALRESEINRSTTSLDNRPNSIRDVALAGKTGKPRGVGDGDSLRDSRGVSPVSSEGDERHEDLNDPITPLSPPRRIEDFSVRSSSSPTRDSRFREMMDS